MGTFQNFILLLLSSTNFPKWQKCTFSLFSLFAKRESSSAQFCMSRSPFLGPKIFLHFLHFFAKLKSTKSGGSILGICKNGQNEQKWPKTRKNDLFSHAKMLFEFTWIVFTFLREFVQGSNRHFERKINRLRSPTRFLCTLFFSFCKNVISHLFFLAIFWLFSEVIGSV